MRYTVARSRTAFSMATERITIGSLVVEKTIPDTEEGEKPEPVTVKTVRPGTDEKFAASRGRVPVKPAAKG